MTDKFEFIENLKTKKISQDQGFPFLTKDIPVYMNIQNTNERYLIGEFGSILSGEIKITVDVAWGGSGSNYSASYYIIDEFGDEQQFEDVSLAPAYGYRFNANVKSGLKYKIYVMIQMQGNMYLNVRKYNISGNIIETFMPIVF